MTSEAQKYQYNLIYRIFILFWGTAIICFLILFSTIEQLGGFRIVLYFFVGILGIYLAVNLINPRPLIELNQDYVMVDGYSDLLFGLKRKKIKISWKNINKIYIKRVLSWQDPIHSWSAKLTLGITYQGDNKNKKVFLPAITYVNNFSMLKENLEHFAQKYNFEISL